MRALDLVFPAVLAVVVLAGSLLLYPWDSDASIIAHDPVYYAESGQSDPWGSVPAQHLLYHVLVNIVTGAGEVMGVEHPGHAAVRLVSGMGALALLLLICTIAGPGRRSLGALLCLPLLLTRTFVFEAAVGESVIPGAAAGLWMLRVSCQLRATTRLTVFAVVLACLMRQDNVLLVPVAMVCFALRASPGQGARRTFRVFGVAGAITAALYLIAWMVTEPQAELLEYVIHVASEPWSAGGGSGRAAVGMEHLLPSDGGPRVHGRAAAGGSAPPRRGGRPIPGDGHCSSPDRARVLLRVVRICQS